MRGVQRPEYKSDEKDIGTREAFEWNAKVQSPGHATWYKGSKTYWTERAAKDDDGISVAEEDRDPNSLLNHYRRVLGLRAAHPAFRSGNQRVLEGPEGILAVERTDGRERVIVVANLSDKPADYSVTGRDLLTGGTVASLRLRPYEAAIVGR
jgi:glycosidase